MTRAEELVNRIVTELETRGYTVTKNVVNGFWGIYYIIVENNKKIKVYETYRHNGTKENVTAKIETWKLTNSGSEQKKLYETKVPYEASKRVINNRIDKALEKFLYSDPTPFTMDMLDPYFS